MLIVRHNLKLPVTIVLHIANFFCSCPVTRHVPGPVREFTAQAAVAFGIACMIWMTSA